MFSNFAWIQGSELVSENIKHCKISQMYAKLSPLSVCLLRRNFYLYADCKNSWRHRVINIYVAKNRKHSWNCANKYAKAREPWIWLFSKFSTCTLIRRLQSTEKRGENAKTLRKVINIREFVRKHTRKCANSKLDYSWIFATCTPVRRQRVSTEHFEI